MRRYVWPLPGHKQRDSKLNGMMVGQRRWEGVVPVEPLAWGDPQHFEAVQQTSPIRSEDMEQTEMGSSDSMDMNVTEDSGGRQTRKPGAVRSQ